MEQPKGLGGGAGGHGMDGVRSSLLPVYPALPSVLRAPSSHRPGSRAASHSADGKRRLRRLAGCHQEPRIHTPNQTLTPTPSGYQPGGQVKGGGRGESSGCPANTEPPAGLLRLFSPHPAPPGFAVLGSPLKPHPGSACPTYGEPGGSRAPCSGEEGGQRAEL